MNNKISYKEIEEKVRNSSWLCYINNKIAAFLVYKFQNLPLTANVITNFSFFLFLLAIPILFLDLKILFILFLILSYTFDNVDGIWARLKNQTSAFGAWLDSTSDRIKEIIILIAFVFIFKGLLNVIMIMSIFFYLVYLILVIHSKVYLNLESPKDKNISKKFKIIAFGPAEFYLLISAIVIFPDKFKIIPLIILSIYFLLMMMIVLFRSIKNINTLEIKE